jgi:serine/threonine-protein kinase
MSEHPSWEFEEGTAIVDGRVALKSLGGGSRYDVYLVWDERLFSLAVAKLLRPDQVTDEKALRDLEKEVEVLQALAHPVLVRCFDAVLDGDRPHLVLELLDGPRLSTLERRYGIIVEQLLPLALQLCSALHYMAARGYSHLDVKPRNIIMSSTPKLIDLSVARRFEDARRTPEPIGTDAYMAPEQCDPARFGEIGPETDVYGLGVTLYEALARRRPFPDGDESSRTPSERFPQLVHAPEPLPKEIPPVVAEVVSACLSDDPGERPSAAEVAERLEPIGALLPLPRLGRFRPGASPARPPAPPR